MCINPPVSLLQLTNNNTGKTSIWNGQNHAERHARSVSASSYDIPINEQRRFPYKFGYDASGTIAAIGSSVTKFKIGDPVLTKAPTKGSIAQYHLSTEHSTSHKPASISFANAAALPLASLTALQAIHSALSDLDCKDFTGKTVFVPAALSGTGLFAIQLAKNVFGAEKVITTASTGKIPRIGELIGEGVADEIIDYTKSDPVKIIGKEKVDYLFDTIGAAVTYAPVMRKGGVIKSISTLPSGKESKRTLFPDMPWYLVHAFDLVNAFYRWRVGRFRARYSYYTLEANAEGLDEMARYVEEGKVRVVIGKEVELEDIEAVRKGCQEIYKGKGGVGKFVIKITGGGWNGSSN